MPKVTSVEPQKKNSKRFNIFIDGNFAFGADEDLVVSERLIIGKEIEKKDLEKLLYEAEVGKLMGRMYGLFSIRARSEKEIRDYLKNLSFKRKISSKGRWTSGPKDQDEISEASINLIIERLKQKNMLNDLEFAKAWVEGRRRSKQKGINVLKQELYQKGIDREIVEEVLSEPFDCAQGEEELAKIALEKKLKSWQTYAYLDKKKKALGYLMRKGFDWELSKSVVEKMMGKE